MSEKRDPYFIVLAATWLTLVGTAIHVWLSFDRLPLKMATHFDAASRPNGWSSRSDAISLTFMILGGTLVLMTLGCYATRRWKPSHSVPVLLVAYFAVGLMTFATNSVISWNLPT